MLYTYGLAGAFDVWGDGVQSNRPGGRFEGRA